MLTTKIRQDDSCTINSEPIEFKTNELSPLFRSFLQTTSTLLIMYATSGLVNPITARILSPMVSCNLINALESMISKHSLNKVFHPEYSFKDNLYDITTEGLFGSLGFLCSRDQFYYVVEDCFNKKDNYLENITPLAITNLLQKSMASLVHTSFSYLFPAAIDYVKSAYQIKFSADIITAGIEWFGENHCMNQYVMEEYNNIRTDNMYFMEREEVLSKKKQEPTSKIFLAGV